MSKEGRLREQIDKGKQVDAIIKNPMFTEVFANLEEQFLSAWKMSSMKDSEERERIYYLYQSLQALKDAMTGISGNGRLAKSQLNELIGRQSTLN